jgi:tetratricopeptide (TPR) repeat protein
MRRPFQILMKFGIGVVLSRTSGRRLLNAYVNMISWSRIVVFLILCGGLGGIISGAYPVTGAILTLAGVIAALSDHVSSDARNRENDAFVEAQALLLANKGIGNLYSEIAKLETRRGRTDRAFERYKKALEINPNDTEALWSLGVMLALQVAYAQWLGCSKKEDFKNKLSAAKTYVKRGMEIDSKNHIFYDILGIIYDTEGNHEKAREEFRRSGILRTDPYWHLLMATSWGMSEQHGKELAEVRKAIEKGADNWLVDYYYGRAFNNVGDFDHALPRLKRAFETRGTQVHILRELIHCYYMQGWFDKAGGFALQSGFALLRRFPVASWRNFKESVHHYGLYIVITMSGFLWPITRRISVLSKIHQRIASPAQPYQTLGIMLIERGHYRFAEKHLQTACNRLPNIPENLANLSSCLALQNKRIEAIEKITMAINCARDERLLKQLKWAKGELESQEYSGPKQIVKLDRNADIVRRKRI